MTPASAPTALITGAAGGIGAALVLAFEAAGWRVVSTDRRPIDRENHIACDIAVLNNPQASAHGELIARLRRATDGKLQALVANAAHQVVKHASELTAADWRETLDVNLLAPFWLAVAFQSELAAQHGSFLAISSIHERLTKPGFIAYATSKGALSAMIRAMAVEMGGQVRCNAICPAAIATPMLRDGFKDQPHALAALEAYHPVGRLGEPDEVAQAAVYACSPQAGFLNGACIDLSGGISSRLHDPI